MKNNYIFNDEFGIFGAVWEEGDSMKPDFNRTRGNLPANFDMK